MPTAEQPTDDGSTDLRESAESLGRTVARASGSGGTPAALYELSALIDRAPHRRAALNSAFREGLRAERETADETATERVRA